MRPPADSSEIGCPANSEAALHDAFLKSVFSNRPAADRLPEFAYLVPYHGEAPWSAPDRVLRARGKLSPTLVDARTGIRYSSE